MALAEAALGVCAFSSMHVTTWVRSWEKNAAYIDVRGHCVTLCSLSQLKLEDRSVVPRDVVRHMRSTVSLGAGVAWGCLGRVSLAAGAVRLLGPGCRLLPRTVSVAP